jgi:signal transduction histidine kinase
VSSEQLALRRQLTEHRPLLVDRWFRGIATTSFSPRPLAEVRRRLDQLASDAIDALLADPFPRELARSIGVGVADLHYLSPQAASATVRALGQHLTEALPPAEAAALQPRVVELLAEVVGGFFVATHRAILDEQDEIRNALFVTRQQAEAADEARVRAEASARARSELLGHVAHDLRSPLTSIRGHAELIAQRAQHGIPSVEWVQTRVASIRSAADRMQAMIGELLDAARLQLGEALELHLQCVDLHTLIPQLVAREAAARKIVLDLPDGPLTVTIDPARFERVLQNLLSNAVKFSPSDSPIVVQVRRDGDTLCIAVRDRGMGIPADELPRITTPFYRASTAGGVPGTGLGLAGVKAIVEQHHGRLTIDSTEGEGTCVAIHLPA